MTISHNWLSEYLPIKIEPERLSRILTSIGLEVESLDKYEEVKGGLKGLILAEVIESSVESSKYMALHKTAPVGTILQIKNEGLSLCLTPRRGCCAWTRPWGGCRLSG